MEQTSGRGILNLTKAFSAKIRLVGKQLPALSVVKDTVLERKPFVMSKDTFTLARLGLPSLA